MPKKTIGMGMKELLKMSLDKDIVRNKKEKKQGNKKNKVKELEAKIIKLENELKNKKRKDLKIDFDKIYSEAIKKIKNKEFYESLALFNVLTYFEPKNIKYLNNSAVVLYNLGLREEAIKILRKILELEPDNDVIKENLNILLSEE